MKYIIMLSLLLFPPKTQELNNDQVDKVLSVSALVRAKQYIVLPDNTVRRGISGCSGTYITESTILTAAHCFSMPTTDIWVRSPRQPSHEAVLVKVDRDHDLAILSVKNSGRHAFAKVALHARLGEKVVNVGSPFRLEYTISEGIVAAKGVEAEEFKATYIITTAMINPGSSGGGAFNRNGELIGVNTMSMGGFFGWAGISMAVDGATIKAFLK